MLAYAALSSGMDPIDAGAKGVEAAILERLALLGQSGETVIQSHDASPSMPSVHQ
ncbi:hypothetical protein D3C71_2187160 [compost metagenome]